MRSSVPAVRVVVLSWHMTQPLNQVRTLTERQTVLCVGPLQNTVEAVTALSLQHSRAWNTEVGKVVMYCNCGLYVICAVNKFGVVLSRMGRQSGMAAKEHKL